MFQAAKDAMTSRTALHFVNKKIERYGELTDLRIDSRAKSIEASCRLHGEAQPITVRVDRYVLEESGGQTFVRVAAFSCNRPWLQNLLTDFAQHRRVEVPSWATAAL